MGQYSTRIHICNKTLHETGHIEQFHEHKFMCEIIQKSILIELNCQFYCKHVQTKIHHFKSKTNHPQSGNENNCDESRIFKWNNSFHEYKKKVSLVFFFASRKLIFTLTSKRCTAISASFEFNFIWNFPDVVTWMFSLERLYLMCLARVSLKNYINSECIAVKLISNEICCWVTVNSLSVSINLKTMHYFAQSLIYVYIV